jgi:tripartite-type tricarboxylate transporter receptor subunit TctC
MKMKRRTLLLGLAMAGAHASFAKAAAPSDYPKRPIRLIVPVAAGGSHDTFARIINSALTEQMGQTVIIENRPGAGGTIAADYVAHAAPDGYTLLVADCGPNAIAGSLYPNLNYDVIKSFSPVDYCFNLPMVLVINPTVPANTLQELIAYAKKNPGALNFASQGNGGIAHLMGEMLKEQAGIEITHVPYRGGAPSLQAVLANEVQMTFVSVSTALPQVNAHTVRAIAATGKARSKLLPQVPTVVESGMHAPFGDTWGGIVAPAGTPADIVAMLSQNITKVLSTNADVRHNLSERGFEPVGEGSAAFAAFIRDETAKWGAVVKSTGVTAS